MKCLVKIWQSRNSNQVSKRREKKLGSQGLSLYRSNIQYTHKAIKLWFLIVIRRDLYNNKMSCDWIDQVQRQIWWMQGMQAMMLRPEWVYPMPVWQPQLNPAGKSQTILPKQLKIQQKICSSLSKVTAKDEQDSQFVIKRAKKRLEPLDQKEGRNVYSNIFRSFFKYLYTPSARQFHSKVVSKMNCQTTPEEMEQWFEMKGINHRNYIRVVTIKNILQDDPALKSRIFLMQLNNFLSNYCRLHFLTSHKLKNSNKNYTLSFIRSLKQEMSKVYQASQTTSS